MKKFVSLINEIKTLKEGDLPTCFYPFFFPCPLLPCVFLLCPFVNFKTLHPCLRPSLGTHLVPPTDPLLVPINFVTFWILRPSLRPSLGTHLVHPPTSLMMSFLDTPSSSEDVPLNGTLTNPTFKDGCVIGTPLPRSSPHKCNVTGVSRGRIPITVHLRRLHDLGTLWTRSTLVYL